MKVLFINPILDCQAVTQVGLVSLATQLKKAGHLCKLIIINEQLEYPFDLERIYRDCIEYSPDMIAFSSVNSQYHVVIDIADYLKKKFDVPIIYGGPCATTMPEKCIANQSIDFICVGEGEEALQELLYGYARKESCRNIRNIWLKENGTIIKNPLRPLAKLDSLYPLNFEIYASLMEKILKCRNGWFEFALTRGCHFRCAHCQSVHTQNLYRNLFEVRSVSIDIAIHNLLEILKTYSGIKYFNFNDETFNFNKRYLFEFCEKYKSAVFKKHGIPFHIECRPDLIDDEMCRRLKEAGVGIMKYGVESGSERIRKTILKRNITSQSIRKAFNLCDKYGIDTWAFNMIGLPTETREELYKTFELNGELKPDNFWLSIYYPIEQTELYNYCLKNDLIDYDKLNALRNYRTDSPLRSSAFKEGEIGLMYRISNWFINMYAYPRYKGKMQHLIDKVFTLKEQGAPESEIERFIAESNQQLNEELNPPFYHQTFKHIALKIKK